jgi:MFS family permease
MCRLLRLFAILFSAGICGMCQGFIVPLMSLLMEQRGISSLWNGLSTTAMFLGVIIASPFVEHVVRLFGAKRTVFYSTICCIVMTLLFTLWDNYYMWTAIRLLLGIGLSGLFVGTEIWLNRILTSTNRGRVLSFYGLFMAVGMLIGPQGINLLDISPSAPFLICAACYLIPLFITSRVYDGDAQLDPIPEGETNGIQRWVRIFSLAPFAMCASFVYGYLDAALNGSFPIFGARLGMGVSAISLSISVFVAGSIACQFPLGTLSDRWGRRNTLILASLVGMVCFLVLPLVSYSFWMMLAVLFVAGGALGSYYSLGLAFLGDLLEGGDLPTGNVLYTMLYGVGSLLGPSITGWFIKALGKDAFAWSVAGMLLCYGGFGLLKLRAQREVVFVNKSRGV